MTKRKKPPETYYSKPDYKGGQWHWMRCLAASHLPPAVKLTGLVQATYGDHSGREIRPSIATLAAATGKTGRRVTADRSVLRRERWISLRYGKHTQRDGQVDEYLLSYPDADSTHKLEKNTPRYQKRNKSYGGPRGSAYYDKARAKDTREAGWRYQWAQTVLRSPAFKPSTRIVAAILAAEATNKGAEVHPGVEYLMEATRLSHGSVCAALKELRAAKAIHCLYSGQRDGAGLHDEYLLTEPDAEWIAERTNQRLEQKERESEARRSALTPGPKNDPPQVQKLTGVVVQKLTPYQDCFTRLDHQSVSWDPAALSRGRDDLSDIRDEKPSRPSVVDLAEYRAHRALRQSANF